MLFCPGRSLRGRRSQVPIDVYSAVAHEAGSKVYIEELWSFSYWSTQLLTWLLIPLLQGYVDSGAFTVAARCCSQILPAVFSPDVANWRVCTPT